MLREKRSKISQSNTIDRYTYVTNKRKYEQEVRSINTPKKRKVSRQPTLWNQLHTSSETHNAIIVEAPILDPDTQTPAILYTRPKKSLVKKSAKPRYKAQVKSPTIMKIKDNTPKNAGPANQPSPSSQHHLRQKTRPLFVDLEIEEKKRRAVRAKESATQRKRKKNSNDKQMLLTQFLKSDPAVNAMRRERKRSKVFNDVQGRPKKNCKEKKKPRNSVRMMLQEAEGDPKATRGG